MGVSTLLHPEVSHAQCLPPKSLCPEEVGVALKHADDVIIAYLLQTKAHGQHIPGAVHQQFLQTLGREQSQPYKGQP